VHAYLCLHRMRAVRSAIKTPVSTALPLVSNAAILTIATMPVLLAALMVGNCWAHGRTRQDCDPTGQAPAMVQHAITTVFAWLAAPPDSSR
jgi:hypothetical protein